MKRCLNGRNVACSRSNDTAARLMRETMGKLTKTSFRRNNQVKSISNFHRLQYNAILLSIYRGSETAPARRSTIARWMIKYVLRRWSWRCFTNTMIVMILRMTMARHSVMRRTSHGMHCDAGSGRMPSLWLVLLWMLLVLVAIESSCWQ